MRCLASEEFGQGTDAGGGALGRALVTSYRQVSGVADFGDLLEEVIRLTAAGLTRDFGIAAGEADFREFELDAGAFVIERGHLRRELVVGTVLAALLAAPAPMVPANRPAASS